MREMDPGNFLDTADPKGDPAMIRARTRPNPQKEDLS